MTIDAMKAYLRRRIGGYTVAIKPMQTTNRIFRGVFCDELPNSVDRISYPPPELVRRPGRANREHCSMFYGCVGAFPIFLEIHAKQGDLVALSEWTVGEPLWMHNLGYHPDALERLGLPMPNQGSQRAPLITPIASETNYNRRIRRRMSLAFTADVPAGEEYRYKETIAINELLYDRASPITTGGDNGLRSERVAGTVYPTVKLRGLADNVVLWPNFVDRYLKIKSVRFLRVEAADELTLSYSFLTIGYSERFSGKAIIWQEALAPEPERRTHVNFENGQWVFRDGSNKIYDVH
ncbi:MULTISPECIES: hypothetical protein [unclassified Bradyrhizobium]|uniref:hypothetical protein n=1 Tax=unclassified Bradyrhizobium TaxID=2631580 RepID=UPI0028E5C7C3|nr:MULTISPECIES: hypothetical protein [unclassified Bradyrhizobium]